MEGGQGLAKRVSARLSPKELRRFGFTLAIPFGLIAALSAWRGHTVAPTIFAGLAVILGALSLIAPGTLDPVRRGWMTAANALAWFNTRFLLGIVYYIVITPTGALMRLLGRDPMDRRLNDRSSYWLKRKRRPDLKGSMEHWF
jgi:hypothetical protein